MSESMCVGVRERIPDYVGGRLSATEVVELELHAKGCADCRDELELARLVYQARPAVPEGLAGRVAEAVQYDRRTVHRPWWGVAADAVAALALGIGITNNQPTAADVDVPGYAYELDEDELWLADDGLIAGAPSLDDLSDEALEALLAELEVGSSGGAV